MLRNLILHGGIGLFIYFFGIYEYDELHWFGVGSAMIVFGAWYGIATTTYILLKAYGRRVLDIFGLLIPVGKLDRKWQKDSAIKELLEYKSLLDAEILTQAEYDKKSSELKKKIL